MYCLINVFSFNVNFLVVVEKSRAFFFKWHIPVILFHSFFSLDLVVLIEDILTVPLEIQQVHWLLLVSNDYSFKLACFSENVMCNKDIGIESDSLDHVFFFLLCVLICNTCTVSIATRMHNDQEFMIIRGLRVNRSRQVCLCLVSQNS